jgi:hypothetical protein
MAKPTNQGALEERRKLFDLLDRLKAVDRPPGLRSMPHDAIVDQWLHSDADDRRKIEESIDRLPRKSS